jgi:enoyl-CoA hydratase/carnithine racemase
MTRRDGVAAIVFDRPEAHNAMTWSMYEQLAAHCATLADDATVRVVTLRGAGGKAFVAGTDIEQFQRFTSGEDGIAYERRIDAGIDQIERLPMPVVALLDGWVVGGGLAIAAACDLRIATPEASFGVPIARTLGNCLSAANTARVVAGFGTGPAKRMLLLAEMVGAAEAAACGFVTRVVPRDGIDAAAEAMCAQLMTHAPLTLRASKETIRRIAAGGVEANDDLVRLCYGSDDFRRGVSAFVEKKRPLWEGR